MSKLTTDQLKETAKAYAESIIEDWVFESLGEMADEYDVTFEEMQQIAHLAAHAEVVVR